MLETPGLQAVKGGGECQKEALRIEGMEPLQLWLMIQFGAKGRGGMGVILGSLESQGLKMKLTTIEAGGYQGTEKLECWMNQHRNVEITINYDSSKV